MRGRSAASFKISVSRFPMPGEWHGPADSVMPVRYDVHRTGDAALLADEAPTDHRPGLALGQGVEPHVDHADRNCRLNIGCCRSRDRRRAIPPGRQVGICLSLEGVVAAEPLRMIPRLLTAFSRPAQLRILRLEGTSLFRLRPPTTEDRKERGRQFSSAIVSGGFRVSFRAGLRSALASVLRRCRRE